VLWSEDEGIDGWNGEVSDEDEDESTLKAVKCRWKKCGAVLQSKAHGLWHMQVAHVGKVVVGSFVCGRRSVMANSHPYRKTPDDFKRYCRWKGCPMGPFYVPGFASRPSSVAHPGEVVMSVQRYAHKLCKTSLGCCILTTSLVRRLP
jgi:hypothetical protein